MKVKKPKEPSDHWRRVWEEFQETIEKSGLDNSMGDFNYLIGRYIFESGNYDEREFVSKIKKYLNE